MIDTHVHLEYPDYGDEQAQVIQRAVDAGVELMITVGGETPRNRLIPALVEQHRQLRGALGIHPHWANSNHPDEEAWIAEQLENPLMVAVGEIGLDYHYDYSPRATQRTVFSRYLERAQTLEKPVIIHSRAAYEDTISILREHARIEGVVHCFTYTIEEAEAFLALGLHISFCGQITFKNCEELREAARAIPIERLLLETDSPFLTPEPLRGRRNEPANVRYIAKKHAELRGISIEELDKATTGNARKLFRLNEHS